MQFLEQSYVLKNIIFSFKNEENTVITEFIYRRERVVPSPNSRRSVLNLQLLNGHHIHHLSIYISHNHLLSAKCVLSTMLRTDGRREINMVTVLKENTNYWADVWNDGSYSIYDVVPLCFCIYSHLQQYVRQDIHFTICTERVGNCSPHLLVDCVFQSCLL